MVFTKVGCEFAVISPAGFRILSGAEWVSRKLRLPITITAGTNGKHMLGSKHYDGQAYDVRCKGLDGPVKQALIESLKLELGPQFTVLHEAEGTANEHLHLQLKKGTTYSE
jgi:hypothetical protein